MKKNLLFIEQHCQQTTDFTCGPATILSFMHYHNKRKCQKLTEKKLARILHTCPNIGTHPKNMYDFLQNNGLNVSLRRNINLTELQNNIDHELPSIVLWYDGEEWHWSNVIGYDQKNIILLDPYLEDGLHVVNQEIFARNWSKLAIK